MRLSPFRPLLPILAAILFSALPAAAQQEDTVPRVERRGGVATITGLRLGWPQKVSAYVGIGIPEKRFESGYTGWSVTVEPGLGGGLVGIGRTTTGGIGMTWRGQFAALRTWGDPWLVGPDQTYLGADVRMMIAWFGFSVGGFFRVPDADHDVGALLTASFVIGN